MTQLNLFTGTTSPENIKSRCEEVKHERTRKTLSIKEIIRSHGFRLTGGKIERV